MFVENRQHKRLKITRAGYRADLGEKHICFFLGLAGGHPEKPRPNF